MLAHYPNPPQLAFLSAPYRRIHGWDYLLSAQHARRLRSAVLAYGGPRVVVIAVPWYLTPPKIEEAMTEEEAAVPFRVRNVLGFSRRRSSRKPAQGDLSEIS